MAWYDSDYKRRAAITVHNSAGSATIDIDVTIPTDWDEFWDVIDSSGNELRVCGADGATLLSYDVDNGSGGAFDRTARLGRLRIDAVAVTATADTVLCLWVYFDTVTTQGDASVAVAMASVLTGYIDRARPSWMAYVLQTARPGLSRPRNVYSKDSGDTVDVWVDVTRFLEHARIPVQKRLYFEEPQDVLITAEDSGATNAPTLFTSSAARWVEVYGPGGRRLYLRVRTTAGTSGTNYTIKLAITTRVPAISSAHRVHKARFGLRVLDTREAA